MAWITSREFADKYGLSVHQVHDLIHERSLKAIKIYLVDDSNLDIDDSKRLIDRYAYFSEISPYELYNDYYDTDINICEIVSGLIKHTNPFLYL